MEKVHGMIRYRYYDSDGIASITRDEIIEEYWDIWIKKMKRLHGDTYDSFTEDDCVYDWCKQNAAWLVNEEQM